MSEIQDVNLDQSYIEHLQKITQNWETKKSFNNQELSALTPFVDLYAIFNSQNAAESDLFNNDRIIPSDILQLRLDDPTFLLQNQSSNSGSDLKAVNMAKLESQIARYDYYREQSGGAVEFSKSELMSERGGIGINSLVVDRSTAEPFTVRYHLSMTVTDPKLINSQPQLSKLLTLNSVFVIVNGWDGFPLSANINPVASPTPITESIVNENAVTGILNEFTGQNELILREEDKSNGYWDWNLVKLYQFNFNVNNVGHLEVNLSFVNVETSHLQFNKIRNVSNRVLRKLKKPQISQLAQSGAIAQVQDGDTSKLLTTTEVIGKIDGFESIFLTYPKPNINYEVDNGTLDYLKPDTSQPTYNPYTNSTLDFTNIAPIDIGIVQISPDALEQQIEISSIPNQRLYNNPDLGFGQQNGAIFDEGNLYNYTSSWDNSSDNPNNPNKEDSVPYISGFTVRRIFVDGEVEEIYIPNNLPINVFDEQQIEILLPIVATNVTNFISAVLEKETSLGYIAPEFRENNNRPTQEQTRILENKPQYQNVTFFVKFVRNVNTSDFGSKKSNSTGAVLTPPFVYSKTTDNNVSVQRDNNTDYLLLYNLVIDITDAKIVNTKEEARFYNQSPNRELSYGGSILKNEDAFSYLADGKSALEYNVDNISDIVYADTSKPIENRFIDAAWPYGNTVMFLFGGNRPIVAEEVYRPFSGIKPIAITSAQFEAYLNSVSDNIFYGRENLEQVINSTFIRNNRDSIFNIEDETDIENDENVIRTRQQLINRGSVIFVEQEVEEQTNTEEEDTTSPNQSDRERLGLPSDASTLSEENYRVEFWKLADFIRNNFNSSQGNSELPQSDLLPFNLPSRTVTVGTGPGAGGGGGGSSTISINDNSYTSILLEHYIDRDGDNIPENTSESTFWESIKNSYDPDTGTVRVGVSLGNSQTFTNVPNGLSSRTNNKGDVIYWLSEDQFAELLIYQFETFYDDESDGSGFDADDDGFIDITDISETSTSDKTPTAYYLGTVLEAIASTVNSNEQLGQLNFYYDKIPDEIKQDLSKLNIKIKSFDFSGNEISVQLVDEINTTFDLPVDYKTIDNLLMNKNISSTSVVNLLKDVLLSINSGIMKSLPIINLSYRLRKDKNNSFEVYISSKDYGGTVRQLTSSYAAGNYVAQEELNEDSISAATIALNFGESKSLVESFNIASKIDPLTYAAFRMPTNFGLRSIPLRSILTREDGNLFIEELLTKTSRGEGDLFDTITSEGENVNRRIEQLRNFLNSEDGEYSDEINNDITTLLLANPDNFINFLNLANKGSDGQPAHSSIVSDLLLNFLFNVDATIHGTTGIYLFDPLIINNFLAQTGGIYMVNNSKETITPGMFSTALNLKLHSPFNKRSGFASSASSNGGDTASGAAGLPLGEDSDEESYTPYGVPDSSRGWKVTYYNFGGNRGWRRVWIPPGHTVDDGIATDDEGNVIYLPVT